MNNIIDFYLASETVTKDATAQKHHEKDYRLCVGKLFSVYQSEYFDAAQAGIRPSFKIEMYAVDYHGEKVLKYDGEDYVIYRTYKIGTDKIELHCAERVGVNNGSV
jgi:hypothetical protein